MLGCSALHGFGKEAFGLPQRNAVLRPLGPRQRGFNLAKIELQRVGEKRVGSLVCPEKTLHLGVSVDERQALVASSRKPQVRQRFRIHGKKSHRRAVFGRHIGYGGAIGQREIREACSVELDELSNYTLLAQHLGYGKHQIGGR